jgi:hypothetical protein
MGLDAERLRDARRRRIRPHLSLDTKRRPDQILSGSDLDRTSFPAESLSDSSGAPVRRCRDTRTPVAIAVRIGEGPADAVEGLRLYPNTRASCDRKVTSHRPRIRTGSIRCRAAILRAR